jgi:hypothetical protein
MDAAGINSGAVCPYCLRATEMVDAAEVYGQSYAGRFWMYLCRPCDAYVGTHPGTTRALGRLANKELREWKKLAHRYFDVLWRQKMQNGFSKTKARNLGYKWLSEQLGIPQKNTHIGMFDVAECQAVVAVCKPYSMKILAKENK